MNACCVRRRDGVRKSRGVAAWLVPGGLLVLMPKCPVCLAGYGAAATGLGLSVPAASGLRVALIALCCLSLLFLTFRLLSRRKPSSNRAIP
jgi:hypothetical protein